MRGLAALTSMLLLVGLVGCGGYDDESDPLDDMAVEEGAGQEALGTCGAGDLQALPVINSHSDGTVDVARQLAPNPSEGPAPILAPCLQIFRPCFDQPRPLASVFTSQNLFSCGRSGRRLFLW